MNARLVSLSACLCLGTLIAGSPAQAQQVRVMTSTVEGGDGPSARIGKRNIEEYARLVSLTETQAEAAQMLFEGYDAAYRDASKEFQTALSEMRRSVEETQDHTVFMERMPKARAAFAKKTADLENSLFSDIQSLLTPDQQAHWPRVERQRRRETVLRNGTVSGETINLLELVRALKLDDEASAPVDPALDEYELDLDRALLAKQKDMESAAGFEAGRAFDIEAMQARAAAARETGIRLKDLNARHARRIEALLPEARRAEFAAAVRRAGFPRVYRPSRVLATMDAAKGFSDLTPEQRESIEQVRRTYERDLAAANDRWASAIEESERNGQSGGIALSGGAMMQFRLGAEEDGPLADARTARRELDERAREKIASILTPEQRERLPKEEERGQRDVQTLEFTSDAPAIFIRPGG